MLSIAKRMSYEDNRYRSLIMSTLRKVPAEGPVREALISALPLWGELSTWQSLQRATQPLTRYYLLSAFDRKVDVESGQIKALPADQALYVTSCCGRYGWRLSSLCYALPWDTRWHIGWQNSPLAAPTCC